MPKKPQVVPLGRWQKEIAAMPKKSSREFPASEVRRSMNAFDRAAKQMNRNPSMSTQNDGSVVITLDTPRKRGAIRKQRSK